MNSATILRLLALNRQFYQTFGREFSDKRQRVQPGVRRILESLKGDEQILDLGCGNGELARELARRGHRGSYLGLDFSQPLLEEAQRQPDDFSVNFRQADLSAPDWDAGLPPGHFSLITCFAVLHHIPGAELRLTILQKTRRLLATDGRFVLSNWQFLNSQRLRGRIQPWSEIGLSKAAVDDNDYLLDWRHGGHGLRYAHHFSEDELTCLALASSFKVSNTFYADGEGGKLGLYQVWKV
jgi:tRNA (uracil-5-)-methyltransferase TRM9